MKVAFLLSLGLLAPLAVGQTHLAMARSLSDGLRSQLEAGETTLDGELLNQYGGTAATTILQWGDSTTPYAAVTKCAPFVTVLMQGVYGWNPKTAFGSTGPSAAMYYDRIRDGLGGYERKIRFEDVRPGDVLASKYLDDSASTGHVMIVSGIADGPTDGQNKTYFVEVIDASASKHTNDSRIYNGASWQGVGRGIIRVVTQKDWIAGWSWTATSSLYSNMVRPLVAGHPTFAD